MIDVTNRRDMLAAALLVPFVAMAGRCTTSTVRPIAAATIETSAAVAKGAGRAALQEYRRRE